MLGYIKCEYRMDRDGIFENKPKPKRYPITHTYLVCIRQIQEIDIPLSFVGNHTRI
jgi:hypothetical protein